MLFARLLPNPTHEELCYTTTTEAEREDAGLAGTRCRTETKRLDRRGREDPRANSSRETAPVSGIASFGITHGDRANDSTGGDQNCTTTQASPCRTTVPDPVSYVEAERHNQTHLGCTTSEPLHSALPVQERVDVGRVVHAAAGAGSRHAGHHPSLSPCTPPSNSPTTIQLLLRRHSLRIPVPPVRMVSLSRDLAPRDPVAGEEVTTNGNQDRSVCGRPPDCGSSSPNQGSPRCSTEIVDGSGDNHKHGEEPVGSADESQVLGLDDKLSAYEGNNYVRKKEESKTNGEASTCFTFFSKTNLSKISNFNRKISSTVSVLSTGKVSGSLPSTLFKTLSPTTPLVGCERFSLLSSYLRREILGITGGGVSLGVGHSGEGTKVDVNNRRSTVRLGGLESAAQCSKEGRVNEGEVRQQQSVHIIKQKRGTRDSLLLLRTGNKTPQQSRQNHHTLRQHDRSQLSQEVGRKKSGDLGNNEPSPSLLRSSLYLHHGETHSRLLQHQSRQAISQHSQDSRFHANRGVVQVHYKKVGTRFGRPLRFVPVKKNAKVRIVETRPQSTRSGRSEDLVGEVQKSLRVPSFPPNSKGNKEDERDKIDTYNPHSADLARGLVVAATRRVEVDNSNSCARFRSQLPSPQQSGGNGIDKWKKGEDDGLLNAFKEIKEYINEAISDSTIKKREKVFITFKEWVSDRRPFEHLHQSLYGVSLDTIFLYLNFMVKTAIPSQVLTIIRHIDVSRSYRNLPLVRDHPLGARLKKRLSKDCYRPTGKSFKDTEKAYDPALLFHALASYLPPRHPDYSQTLRYLNRRAIIAVRTSSYLRGGDVINIELSSVKVKIEPFNNKKIVVYRYESKTEKVKKSVKEYKQKHEREGVVDQREINIIQFIESKAGEHPPEYCPATMFMDLVHYMRDEKYRKWMKFEGDKSHDWLFVRSTPPFSQMHPDTCRNITKEVMDTAGIDPSLSPHSVRAMMCEKSMRMKVNLLDIMKMAHWKSATTPRDHYLSVVPAANIALIAVTPMETLLKTCKILKASDLLSGVSETDQEGQSQALIHKIRTILRAEEDREQRESEYRVHDFEI